MVPNSVSYYRSASYSHVGMVRKVNEDASLDAPEAGLWVVADGMGGHAAGDFVSSLIVDTLVLLAARGNQASCLWAGDSRLYRLRGGVLEAISRDHSYVQELLDNALISEEEARHHPRANVVTRAVGVHEQLELSEAALHVLPGDSFLLCSDGLNKTADDSELRDVLSHSDPYAVVRSLVHLGLTRGAPDNITALVVRAF